MAIANLEWRWDLDLYWPDGDNEFNFTSLLTESIKWKNPFAKKDPVLTAVFHHLYSLAIKYFLFADNVESDW